MDKDNVVGALFLDMSKAFDRWSILSCLGNWVSMVYIRGKELEWFNAYQKTESLHRRGKEQVD